MEFIRERFQVNTENEEKKTWKDEMGDDFKDMCPSLSYETRLYAFAGCFIGGFLCSLLSTLWISTGQITLFGLFYSLGSIAGLLSTIFLVGPLRQIKLMFDKSRWIATLIYLLIIGFTLFVGFYTTKKFKGAKKIPLIILLVICQFLSGIWYALSYIPYARKVISKFSGGALDCLMK